jgi:hypothetical protein
VSARQLELKYGELSLGAEHTLHYILRTVARDVEVPEFKYAISDVMR